jgi:hypothetical protein
MQSPATTLKSSASISLVRRLDTSIALQMEKFHADAEGKRREKEAARARREAAQAARYGT